MMNVRTMDIAAFGQLTEQVVGGRGGYDPETQAAVYSRLAEVGQAVGRSSVIQFTYDGEVGPQINVTPKSDYNPQPRKPRDPLEYGI